MIENTTTAANALQAEDAMIGEVARDAADNGGLASVTLHRNGDLTTRYSNGYSNTYAADHPANCGIGFRRVAAILRATLRKTIKQK